MRGPPRTRHGGVRLRAPAIALHANRRSRRRERRIGRAREKSPRREGPKRGGETPEARDVAGVFVIRNRDASEAGGEDRERRASRSLKESRTRWREERGVVVVARNVSCAAEVHAAPRVVVEQRH